MTALFGRATAEERDFLTRLIGGELRQGALEGIVVEAIAKAEQVPAAAVRRAAMMAGDLAAVAVALRAGGEAALARFDLQLFRPVQPMLADTAENVADAIDDVSATAPALEWKLDGARIQVHKAGDDVRVYTRHLQRRDRARCRRSSRRCARCRRASVILDGEVIALRPTAAAPVPDDDAPLRPAARRRLACAPSCR